MRLATLLLACTIAGAWVAPSRGQSTVDFAKEVQPIFAAHCAGCHGEEKGLGRLRLHTDAGITESKGVHDDLIIVGKPDESQLYARLVLPEGDPKRMPKGADPLDEKQIEVIKKWIEEGATFEVTATAEPAGEAPMAEEPAEPEVEERPPLQPAAPEAIAAVEESGALVIPLYAGSAELRVSFPSNRDQVTDETVAALTAISGQLVELDLSGTKITDACGDSLTQFTNLDTLHLEKTEIGDPLLESLKSMRYLQYLNLHSTNVTDAGLVPLESLKNLRKLYLWQTDVSYDAAKALEKTIPGLAVNLGWDHPGVVRERLTKEMARVEQKQAESTTTIEEAQKALEAAQAEKKAADERAAEIQKQLEALDQPAPDGEEAPAEQAEAPPENQADASTT